MFMSCTWTTFIQQMGVSEDSGTPKWMIWGYTIFGNTQIVSQLFPPAGHLVPGACETAPLGGKFQVHVVDSGGGGL